MDKINDGNYSTEAARIEEGWFVGDNRKKPAYLKGQQRYGEDDYMEPIMKHLRSLPHNYSPYAIT